MEISESGLSERLADAYSRGVAVGAKRSSDYMQRLSDAEIKTKKLETEKKDLLIILDYMSQNEEELQSAIRSNSALRGVITKLKKKINSEKK